MSELVQKAALGALGKLDFKSAAMLMLIAGGLQLAGQAVEKGFSVTLKAFDVSLSITPPAVPAK